MGDAKSRRKFQCPNCDHWVKFQVDPESTLIACDHCGQLTRVTMKTSQSVENASRRGASNSDPEKSSGQEVMSEAFDDLDLDGLDQGDLVRSSTIRKMNLRGRTADDKKVAAAKAQSSSKAKSAKRGDQNSRSTTGRASDSTAPESSRSGKTEGPDGGLSSPIPPPYVPVPVQETPDSQSDEAGSLGFPPQSTDLAQETSTFAAVPPPPPTLASASDSESQSDAQANSVYDSGIAWVAQPDPRPEMEILDLENLAPVTGEADEQAKMEILEDLTELTEVDDSGQDTIRIKCAVCDSADYFRKSSEYVCPDCYSRMDEQGNPVSRPHVAGDADMPSESEGQGDEIDDLIRTARQPRSAGGDGWQNEPTTPLMDATEVGRQPTPGSEPEDTVGELRLAPLDEPTSEYRSSVLPHGMDTESYGEPHRTPKGDSDQASMEPADDDLVEWVDENEQGNGNQAASLPAADDVSEDRLKRFHWKAEPELDQPERGNDVPDTATADREHDVSLARENESEPTDPQEPTALGDEPAAETSKTIVPAGSSSSLFLDGGEVEERPETPLASQYPPGSNPRTSTLSESESLADDEDVKPPPFPGDPQRSSAPEPASATATSAAELQDPDHDPMAYGWFGNWLPVVTSSWVLLGVMASTLGFAIELWLGYRTMDPTVVSGWRVMAAFGALFFLVPTMAVWTWLMGIIVDGDCETNPVTQFSMERYVTHLTRLGFCMLLCLPGMVAGGIVGFPVLGTVVAVFYASPIALFWLSSCQFSGKKLTLIEKPFMDLVSSHTDLFMTAIAVVGLAGMACLPFLVLASFVPVPGLFLLAPMLVLFTVAFAIQVHRLVSVFRVLATLSQDD